MAGLPDHDVRNHSLPQLTCHIQLQSYWAAVFWFLKQYGVSVSATCLLRKQTVTVIKQTCICTTGSTHSFLAPQVLTLDLSQKAEKPFLQAFNDFQI